MPKNLLHSEENTDRITISDVAKALGISTTTVSRAISGKGRIGEETRARVLAYIQEMDYHPSLIAQGLANSKTYNIGWVIPGEASVTDLPFFQNCMLGVSETAASQNYDVLLTTVYEKDISSLERIVKNHKVDGIILGQTLTEDARVRFLQNGSIPFVVIGSTPYGGVVQIDNDHISACKELTSILIMKGIGRIALIGGADHYVVNQSRLRGFELGMEAQGREINRDMIFMNCDNEASVSRAVEESLRSSASCILCMDDKIGYYVLDKLKRDKISIPQDVRVASFYNSDILENNQPAVTALRYDSKELGREACRTLFQYMNGDSVPERRLMNYEVMLKASTQ